MANITNSSPVVTEDKLKDFYEDIKPFLGCPAYLTSEGNSDYYSTDEKVIGRWIDGKPLYQKVVYLNDNDPTTTWTSKNIPHNISNVDYISGYGFFQEAYDNNKSTFWLNTVSGNEYFRCTFNKTNITIGRSSNWVMQGYAWIILNYTKTTDSATTTIQEDPNEYSTDEKIIGKWIDGKPIYQKTFTGTVPTFTPPSNSVLDPATLDIAMDCLVDVFVSVSGFIQTVAGNYVPLPFTEITKNVTYKESSSATTLDSYSQTIAVYGRPNASTSMPNNIRVVNMNQNFNNRPLCVTAQYTKTTD